MKNEHAESYIFLGSIILATALVGLIFLPELNVIVLGVTFTVLFQPVYDWLARRMPRQGGIAALLVVVLAILLVLAPVAFFGFQLFGEAQGLYAKVASGGDFPVVRYLEAKLGAASPSFGLDLNSYLQQMLSWIAGNLGLLFSAATSALFTVFISFFAFFYFLKDGARLREAIIRKSPFSPDRTAQLITKLHIIMSSIVRGTLFVSVLYGIATGFGFFMFGLSSGVLWGAVAAFASLIPVFGVFLVIVPGMIALALAHHYVAAVGLFLWINLVGLFMENMIRPRLIGRQSNIHPLLVLFSVLGGLSFFGPLGLLLGPLALGLLLALLEVYPTLLQKD